MAEASITSLFPQSQTPRAAEAPSSAAQPPKKAESKGPSRFESELRNDKVDRTEKTDKSDKTDKAVKADRPAAEATAKGAKGAKDKPDKDPADRGDGQVLQPLRRAAAKNKQAVDAAPVVALLTGKLDRLSPAAIPELVSNNEFVSSALSEAELEGFMAKPAPVRELLESLGVPPAVMAEAEQLGLDLAAIVSPNELLRALGVDPQRVFSELKLLKDNLALDGVQGYMRRAAALQKGATPEPATRPDPMQQERLARDAEAARAATERLPRRPAPDLTLGDSLASKQPLKGPQQPASASAPQAAMTPAALAQLSPWQIAAGMASTPATTTAALQAPAAGMSPRDLPLAAPLLPRDVSALTLAGLATPTSNSQASQGFTATKLTPGTAPVELQGELAAASGQSPMMPGAGRVDAQAPLAGLVAASMPTASDVSAATPKLHEASYDAFAWMGERLRGEGTIRLNDVESAAPVTLPADPAAAAQRDPAVTLENFLRDLPIAQPAAAQPSRQAGMTLAALQQQLRPSEAQVRPAMQLPQAIVAPAAEAEDDPQQDLGRFVEAGRQMPAPAAFKEVAPSAPQRVSVDELARVLTLDRASNGKDGDSRSGERGDEGRSFDSSSGFDPSRLIESLGAPAHAGPKSSHMSSFAAEVAAPPAAMTPQERAAIMQQVVDRAAFLARDGGGTVRLDLSSADLGPVELAVNMQNDRLDLRIITASDRTRDLMAGEMSQLRDALTVQNFQLGSVEVGVGRRDSGRGNEAFAAFQQNQTAQQFGGGNDRRGGRAETWEEGVSAMARGLRGIDAARGPAVPSYARMPAMPAADGRIAVRA